MPWYDRETPGKRLRAAIDELWEGSDEEFAETVPISPGQLSRLVNEKASLRSARKASEIARALGIDEALMLYGDSGRKGTHVVRERGPSYGGVDESVAADIDAILAWLPEDMSRRWTDEISIVTRLGEVYAYGASQGWSAQRLEYVHRTRERVEALRRRDDRP